MDASAALATAIEFLWNSNTAPGKVIVLVILIATVIACRQALRHRRRYRTYEAMWLSRVADKLKLATTTPPSTDSAKGQLAEDAGGRKLVELATLMDGVPESSLIGDRLAALGRLRQARVRVNVSALQQMTSLREHANTTLALPAYVANLSMMLGLLGTFLGLSMMVSEIEGTVAGVVSGADRAFVNASLTGLSNVISGKKTAFSCTLVGLFSSIGVSWLNFLLARAQSRFYDQLERFTAEELLPATVPSVEGETALERFSLQFGDSFERLEILAKEHGKTVEYLVAIEKSFGVIIDNVVAITRRGERTSTTDDAVLAGVIAQLTQVNGSIGKLLEALPRMLSTHTQSQERLIADLAHATAREHTAHAAEPNRFRGVAAQSGLAGLVAGGVMWLLSWVAR